MPPHTLLLILQEFDRLAGSRKLARRLLQGHRVLHEPIDLRLQLLAHLHELLGAQGVQRHRLARHRKAKLSPTALPRAENSIQVAIKSS